MQSVRHLRIRRFCLILALFPFLLLQQNCSNGYKAKSYSTTGMSSIAGLDTTPPALNVISPANSALINKLAKITISCESSLPLTYYFDSAQQTQTGICDASGAMTFALPATLVDGAHLFWITQTDLAANKSIAQVQFTLDGTAPVLQLTSPLNGTSLETSQTLAIAGSCETGGQVSLDGSALSAPLAVACVAGKFQASAVLVNTAGSKTLIASETDAAGNKGQQSIALTLALPAIPAPIITITAPAANAVLGAAAQTLKGTCENGLAVAISGTGLNAPVQTTCANAVFQVAIQLSAGDGLKNVIAAQTNAQNKTGQVSRSFTLDTTAPAITIVSPAAGTQSQTGVTIAGACETGLSVSILGAGVDAASTTTCTAATYSAAVNFSTGLGTKVVTVMQTDAVGNSASVSRSFERIAPPALDGPLLYANNCASCHGALASSTKQGRSAATITAAIQNQIPMQSIKLTAAEIDAIATALAMPVVVTVPTIPLSTVRVALNTSNLSAPAAFAGVPVRRLSQTELINSLVDVLKVDPSSLVATLPVDISDEKVYPFDNDSEMQSVSAEVVSNYEDFAQQYAVMFAAQPATIRTLAGCTPTSASDSACFHKFATNVGRLLLRRPITAADLTNYDSLLPYATAANNFYEAPKLLVQAFVQHPEFLYRIEAGQGVTGTLITLSNYEIAARLSYLIWGSAPDSTLMDAAAAGQLSTSAQRASQAQRMLADARAKRQMHRYTAEWLGYDDVVVPATQATAMAQESNALVDQIAFNGTASWMQMFTYDKTYVTPALATHYGISAPTTSPAGWVNRAGGILTHGQFLAQGAKFGDTSPTLRGYKILKRVLCQQLGSVPPGVDPNSPPGTTGQCKPARYSMRTQTSCQGCHALTDNIGFGLENYSSVGQYRTAEPGLPQCTIDGNGSVGTDAFNGAPGLGLNLAQNPVAVQCAVRQLLRFTLGRSTTSTDQNTVEALHAQYIQTPQLTSMIQAIVQTPAFGYR